MTGKGCAQQGGTGQQTDVATGLAETFVLLDNSSGRGRPSLLFCDPLEVVEAWTAEEVPGALERIDTGIARGLHAAGFLAYELGYVLEPRLAALLKGERNVPLIWMGLYREPSRLANPEVQEWLRARTSGSYQFTDVEHAWSAEAYESRFAQVIEKIRAGDIYQLNLTFKARFRLSGSPLAFYRDLREKQPVAYGAIVDTGAVTVLSASPELFIAQHGRRIETRPMKGTAARRADPAADAEEKRILASDEKQRAENLMIVDLMRNDLGRIAEIGSVAVSDLFTVETYRTLHQMTSGVHATLTEGIGLSQLLAAIFPPGSVTGAPKIRAMELIGAYETEPRGVYCGAIGHISPGKTASEHEALFNVAIRTPVMFRDGHGEMGIGSGVVFDSEGAKEYAECLLKMKFLTDPPLRFDLIETLLHEPGRGYWLLERHLARLEGSAVHFKFRCDMAEVRRKLARAVARREGERLRVRLLLGRDGDVNVTVSEQPAQGVDAVMGYVVSPTRIASADPFLTHKTTRRELYDGEWKRYHDEAGADEVIYLNERVEVAEGSRTNIFIERGGRLLTPQISSGLLPGTLRADLIASGRADEAVLKLDDLAKADAVYLGNSVRGLVKAVRLDG